MYHRMPFGKYRGQLLTAIPDGYLRWLLRECDSAEPWLRAAVSEKEMVAWRSIFRTWFAGLARDYHPDRIGGDGREMKAINEAAERLKKLVGIA